MIEAKKAVRNQPESQIDAVGRAPTVRSLLANVPEAEAGQYLVLREAFLALVGTSERLVHDGSAWVPALFAGGQEILRVRFSAARRRKGAGRSRKSAMKISFTAPPKLVDALRDSGELRVATARRLRARRGERRNLAFNLPISREEDLAEGVAMALLLQARL
jgi:hypothetical protein